jgi:hypothetical protein
MKSLWFWKSWSTDYRVLGNVMVFLFVGALLFLWYSYWKGPDQVIGWETFEQQNTQETVSHTFDVGNFEFSVPIESYLTFEYFNGNTLEPNITASYIFILGLVLCSLILLCIITTLERFWFFVGLALFILFMVSLRLEVLRLFTIGGRTIPIVIITLYVLVSFYFNAIRSSTPFLLRLITFSSITTIIALIIHFFSGVDYPFLHLAVTGYLPGLILSVIFILMIAHEIMASFVYITSTATSSTKSLRHYLFITVIYLGNLLIAYLHEARIIDWNFLYINLYLLLSTSAILGIWGFRQREVLYENITRFNPFGAYFITSLSIITFLTTAMLLGNHNDPALKIIRDVIIFSHLGYGVIFFIYVVSNFLVMMAENLSAYKVLYKPTRMPYFTFRFAGLIATMAFVFYSNWREYVYHGMSGFYNQLGDLYELLDEKTFAEAYYQQGKMYGFQNNRSNYILGMQEAHANNFKKAHQQYDLANGKRPTEYSLANKGNLYLIEGRYFEGITFFRKSLNIFPSSGEIQNNLGFAYSKIHKLDSALVLLDQARRNKDSKTIAETNFIGLIGKEYLPVNADSLLHSFVASSPLAISNALAVATLQRQAFTREVNPLTSPLDLASATLLNNYLVHHLKTLDTATVNAAYRIVSDSINQDYSEAIKASIAQAYYHQNNVYKALETMSELAFLSQIMQGKFNYIAGLWALEQGCPELAISYFDYAVLFDYKEARLYNTIALAEAGNLTRALSEADSLVKNPDETIREIGQQLKKIITLPVAELQSINDLEKYQFCRYRITSKDTALFNRVVPTFQSNNYKASALLEMSERLFDMNNIPQALYYVKKIENIPVTDPVLIEKVKHYELTLLSSTGNLSALAKKINEGISFTRDQELEKLLFQALISEASGDTLTAERNFTILAKYNPFFEEGIIAAARYFKKHSPDDMRAYALLANAVHINTTSYRLWLAYINEALSVGFDNQAADAMQLAEEVKKRK